MHDDKYAITKQIRYLTICFEYLSPLCIKLDKTTNKVFVLNRRSTFILFLMILITFINLYFLFTGKILQEKIGSVYGATEAAIGLSNIFKYLSIIHFCTYYKSDVIKTWNNILNINETSQLFCKNYRIHHKLILFFVITSNVLDYVCSFYSIVTAKYRTNDVRIFCIISATITTIITTTNNLKYVIFLTILKSYCRQLNIELKCILKNPFEASDMEILKDVSRTHQKFYEYIKLIIHVIAPTLIVIFIQSTVCLISYTYFLIVQLRDGNCNYLMTIALIYMLLNLLSNIALIMIPSEFCMKHVIFNYTFGLNVTKGSF